MEIKYNKNGSINKRWLDKQNKEDVIKFFLKELKKEGFYPIGNKKDTYYIENLVNLLSKVKNNSLRWFDFQFFKKEKNYLIIYYQYDNNTFFEVGKMDLSQDKLKIEVFNKKNNKYLKDIVCYFNNYKKEDEWVFNYLQGIAVERYTNDICQLGKYDIPDLLSVSKYHKYVKGFKFNEYNDEFFVTQFKKHILKTNYFNIYNQDKYKIILCGFIDYVFDGFSTSADEDVIKKLLNKEIKEEVLLTIIDAHYRIAIKNAEQIHPSEIYNNIESLIEDKNEDDLLMIKKYNAHSVDDLYNFIEDIPKMKMSLNENHLDFYKKYNNIKIDDDLTIIVPITGSDIIKEANSQRNCLKSYLDRITNDNTYAKRIIFFIRHSNALDKSYITCEYNPNDKLFVQIKLKFNNELPKREEYDLKQKLLSIFNNN